MAKTKIVALYESRDITHNMPTRCTERRTVLSFKELREAIGDYVAKRCDLTALDPSDELVLVVVNDDTAFPVTELEATLIARLDTLDERSPA